MVRCVSAPWPPPLRSREQLAGAGPMSIRVAHRTHQSNIGSRKGVRLSQLSHGNILCRPFADSRERAKPDDRILEITSSAKDLRIRQHGRCQGRKRRGALLGHAKRREIGLGQTLWTRENMGEAIASTTL